MIGVSEIMNGVDKVNGELLFPKTLNTRTRRHPIKLVGDRLKTDKRKNLLCNTYSTCGIHHHRRWWGQIAHLGLCAVCPHHE